MHYNLMQFFHNPKVQIKTHFWGELNLNDPLLITTYCKFTTISKN